MSDPIDVDAAKNWLNAVPGGEIGQRLEQSWQDFAAVTETVVTIYGSYDTGRVRSCAGYLSSSGRRFQLGSRLVRDMRPLRSTRFAPPGVCCGTHPGSSRVAPMLAQR